MDTKQEFMLHMDQLHTTSLGKQRIQKNLSMTYDEMLCMCKQCIMNNQAIVKRKGKNWYVAMNDIIITIHANSYTIITAHKGKHV